MKTLIGIEVEDDYFNYLFDEQSKGKELKVIDGKVVAVEHEVTEEELTQKEIYELEARLNQLSQDIVQIQCGADFGTRIDEEGNEISIADERVAEFREKHNRLRYLKGKEPREYK